MLAVTSTSRRGTRRAWSSAWLLTLSGIALAIRTLSVAQPLGIDQSLWASAARSMDGGLKLYQDVWEQRPPGIYFTYLGAFSAFGWQESTVAWLDVLASIVTTFLLYALGRALAGSLAGALAAALYAVLTTPAWLYTYGGFLERSVCETFIVVCAGLAALCGIRLRERLTSIPAFGFGLAAGAAVVFKPNAALCFPALFVWSLARLWPLEAARWRLAVRTSVAALAGATILPALTVLWLWQSGLLADAKTAVVDFNRWYVAVGFTPADYALALSRAVWLRMKTDPLWLAGAVGSICAVVDLVRSRRLAPLAALALVWGVGTVAVIVVNGIRLFNSYFIQALPPLSLIAAWWLTSGARAGRVRRGLIVVTAALMLGLLVQRNFVRRVGDVAMADARVLTGRMDRQTYLERFGGYSSNRGYSARANQELADYLSAHTTREDRIFLFGINGAGVYFLADRLPAHRFLRVNFFVPGDFPDREFTLASVVEDLVARRPRYVIFERLHTGAAANAVDELPNHTLVRPLLAAYEFEVQIEDFALYRRK